MDWYKREVGYMVDFILDNVVEIIEIIIVFFAFFGMKATFLKMNLIFGYSFMVLFSFIWHMRNKSPVFILFYVFFITIEIYLLYSEFNFKEILSKVLWSIMFINIIDAMVYSSITSIFGYFGIENGLLIKISTYIIVLLLLLIANFLIREKIRILHKISLVYYIVYLLIGVGDYLLLTYVFVLLGNIDRDAIVISIIVSASILIQYNLIVLITMANEGLKYQQHLNHKYLTLQQENYEYLEYREEETKKFRHDYKNHLNSLLILCKDNKYGDVEKYIEDISERLDINNRYISVSNSFVDAILNYYYQKLGKAGIIFNISGKLPKNCYIAMFDLCTIISNLLDNASEAVELLEEDKRWVTMTFRYDDLMVYCNVVNPYTGELNVYKNKILSKKNTKNHGYGLINVKRSVDIYNGSIDIKTGDGIFGVLIALVNKDGANKLKI